MHSSAGALICFAFSGPCSIPSLSQSAFECFRSTLPFPWVECGLLKKVSFYANREQTNRALLCAEASYSFALTHVTKKGYSNIQLVEWRTSSEWLCGKDGARAGAGPRQGPPLPSCCLWKARKHHQTKQPRQTVASLELLNSREHRKGFYVVWGYILRFFM